jgi:3-oxoacyl-[acyl-carrier-protein] synthase-1
MGISSQQCFEQVKRQLTSIKQHTDTAISATPFYAARLSTDQTMMLESRYRSGEEHLSPFEQMCVYAVEQALDQCNVDVTSEDCILILSSTKGNIEWLGKESDERISLHYSAKLIAQHFSMKHKPVVVSNACISGSLALITGARFLQNGKYKTAIVIGCDRLSGFVLSGFHSFKAIADGPCRPFDKDRTGINLGEAAACIILSNNVDDALNQPLAYLSGGGVSNDANHLSGPSRTGAELSAAIDAAINEAGIDFHKIDMISAHGTATLFNDEMEAKAITLSHLNKVPLHSLKSYVGHTLGAAGIIESIIACMAMNEDIQPVSLGFNEIGVTEHVQVNTVSENKPSEYILKTASGFGGCNAALVWKKCS